MNVTYILDVVLAMVVVAIALSVVQTNVVAAACLIQFALLTISRYELQRFRSVFEDYHEELTVIKVGLLTVAFVDLAVVNLY